MCGRYANVEDPAVQAAYFRAKLVAKTWKPTWNAAPTQSHPVVVVRDSERELSVMQWGWRRAFGEAQFLVNARGEEAAGKPTWASALAMRRCLVPATAFYEWVEAEKQPYAFRLAGQPLMAIAGVWETSPTGASFVLLTTPANALVAPVHHRMACLLDAAGCDAWLDPSCPAEQIRDLIVPFPAAQMEAFPVSRAVNSVRNDGPHLLDRVALSRQESLFSES